MLQIENKLGKTLDAEKLKKVYQKILKKFVIDPAFAECGLHIVKKKEMKEFNQKFRKINKPTDVLSFPIDEPLRKIRNPKSEIRKQKNETVSKFEIRNSSLEIILGDIFICTEMMRPETSLEKTFIHGLLHLLGLNHQEQKKYGYF